MRGPSAESGEGLIVRAAVNLVHYAGCLPIAELSTGGYNLALLRGSCVDGITDVAAPAFYPHFDRVYPGADFILTVGEKPAWLAAMEQYWSRKVLLEDVPGTKAKLRMRRFLRATLDGCSTFGRERLAYVEEEPCV